jgi:hypothetical protein
MDNKYLKYILFISGTVRRYRLIPKYSVPKRKNKMTSGTELTSLVSASCLFMSSYQMRLSLIISMFEARDPYHELIKLRIALEAIKHR